MSDVPAAGSATGPLDSVRQLEQALESSATARTAADERLEAARSEAVRLLSAARQTADATAAERRRLALASADEDAAAIRRAGEARVEQLRADAGATREVLVEAALALILPAGEKGEV